VFVDKLNDNVSCTTHKQYLYSIEVSPDSMSNMTFTCNNTEIDSVGNTSIASLEVYEVFDEDDIEFCFHGPKIIPKNETPATICTVNIIGAIHSKQLFGILLKS
jgi:hypothetical protein